MPDREIFKLNPQVNISRSTATRMWVVCGCAFLAVMQSTLGDSGASFTVALASLLTAILVELLLTNKKHGINKIKDGSAAASALVFALLLPNQIHPIYAVLGTAFAIVVVKYSFGGLGSNWMNPALGAWLFVRFSWPQAFDKALVGSLEYLEGTGSFIDQAVSGFLNRFIFVFLGAELPQGYIDLLSWKMPGIIADRAVLVVILGTIVIAAFQINRSWLSLLYLAVYGFLVKMMGELPLGGGLWNGDVIFSFLSGGTLVTAFILITDPSTGAKSVPGSIAVGVLAAVLGFFFRYYGGVFYGSFFAVALVNALTPLLCRLERRLLYSMPSGRIA